MKLVANIKSNKFNKFINDPRTKKAVQFAKENWRDIGGVIAVALIVQDADTTADMAEASLTLDIMTAASEGVI